jgi:hypothetical protein
MTYSLPEDYDFRPVSPGDMPGLASHLVSIWVADDPAENEPYREHRERIMLRHAQCLGFRCFTASRDDAIVGFSYGVYHGEETGQFGEEQVSFGTHDYLIQKGVVHPTWRDSFDIGELQVLILQQ